MQSPAEKIADIRARLEKLGPIGYRVAIKTATDGEPFIELWQGDFRLAVVKADDWLLAMEARP